MCGYQGHEFGACYPDSICIDGRLYDADNCDDDGCLYGGGELPCPSCATADYLADELERARDGGCGLSMFTPWCAATQWEAAVAKALAENRLAAEIFLATVEPFETDDWPDREAVYANPSLWDRTTSTLYTRQSVEALIARNAVAAREGV